MTARWWTGLITDEPVSVVLSVQVNRPMNDEKQQPEAWALSWVRQHCVGGGWVQLTDRVLARRADDVGWSDASGADAELSGAVESAEGVDADGHSWRLRWSGDAPVVWRLVEHASGTNEGAPAMRFWRNYESTWPGAERMRVAEYHTLEARVGLEALPATGSLNTTDAAGRAWVPTNACFAGWEDGR